ncbi:MULTISPECIES: nuclear transport factor 2 family protein [Buttiauxella]|uniref:nuclear transport factor 2 family protein n=1 Tax=Buttiauxella TaxID=82976 RepID=UPI0010669237|nr:nuclear transport factor 2 family protein [Buttiauxella sp. BIGb0552]TDX20144.1 SnoaL-like protein [Buttiauxella sp. BIGb0552]
MENQEIAHRLALRELVDTFSNLADEKNVAAQMALFTPNAHINVVMEGKEVFDLNGHQQILEAFSGYLAQFSVVYHLNGQQTLEIDGDSAKGIAYCQVVLIKEENGQRIKQTSGVRYQDRYVFNNGKWLISERLSDFMWTDIQPI